MPCQKSRNPALNLQVLDSKFVGDSRIYYWDHGQPYIIACKLLLIHWKIFSELLSCVWMTQANWFEVEECCREIWIDGIAFPEKKKNLFLSKVQLFIPDVQKVLVRRKAVQKSWIPKKCTVTLDLTWQSFEDQRFFFQIGPMYSTSI